MNAGDHNDDFDARLKTRGRLIMPFDDEQLQPPAELDRIVVAQARRALRQDAAVPERVLLLHRWGLPLALAATLVLSFTLVLQLGEQSPTQVAQTATPATAVTVDAAPAAAPPAALQPESELSGRVSAAEVAAPAPRLRAAPPAAAAVADVGAVAKTMNPAMNQAPVRARAEAVSESDAAPATDAAAGAVASPAPAVAAESATMASPAAGTASRETRSDLAARDDPEAWFQHIQRLRAAGQVAAADRELAQLRQRYPDYLIAREKLPKEP